jgi:small subunit ribosomal protein S20
MPITSSAKRAIRVAERKRVFNIRRMNAMKDSVKEFRKLVAEGKVVEAEKKLPSVYQAIDKAAKRGVIKKNTAARKKSRIVALLRKAPTVVKEKAAK